ncbi:hypothetical protein [Herpetosiphon gulosus]|uniref:Uncharacterized protein n=1 Tax=Herpetosiphon gulosus TaxID=1973496 RepID=A0ABP9WX47_9CHLR
MNTLPALTSQRILNDTMALLQTYIPLQATGYRCQTAYGTALSDLAEWIQETLGETLPPFADRETDSMAIAID